MRQQKRRGREEYVGEMGVEKWRWRRGRMGDGEGCVEGLVGQEEEEEGGKRVMGDIVGGGEEGEGEGWVGARKMSWCRG